MPSGMSGRGQSAARDSSRGQVVRRQMPCFSSLPVSMTTIGDSIWSAQSSAKERSWPNQITNSKNASAIWQRKPSRKKSAGRNSPTRRRVSIARRMPTMTPLTRRRQQSASRTRDSKALKRHSGHGARYRGSNGKAVIPAEAGIHLVRCWTPAFAGVTGVSVSSFRRD